MAISFLCCLHPQCRDAGGSMVIHAFGGYYGLAISWVLYRPNLHQSKRLNGSVYHSDVFAMIGGWPTIYILHFLTSHAKVFFVFVFYTTAYQAYHIFYTCCCEACFRKCDNLTVTLTSQAHCSCGCSGPVSTLPSRITVTDSTEQLSTLTSLSPHLFLPPWPSPACQRKEEKWTW